MAGSGQLGYHTSADKTHDDWQTIVASGRIFPSTHLGSCSEAERNFAEGILSMPQ